MASTTPDSPVSDDGVDICYETFGFPHDPAILLLAGGGSSMLFWPEDFCHYLRKNRRYLIRYDYRDTGKSVTVAPGAATYTLSDFADDALQILINVYVAQLLAVGNPDRVASLTLMSTGPVGAYPGDKDLPQMSEELLRKSTKLVPQNADDREEVIHSSVEMARLCAGSAQPFDEVESGALAGAVFDRAINIRSTVNHGSLSFVRWQRERLGEITGPTLVIHGTDDQVLPFAHDVALSKEIKGAKLLALEGIGRDLPRGVWNVVLPALLEQTAASETSG